MKWPAVSPDLNPIEHLQRDLKIAVERFAVSNMRDLKQLANEKFLKCKLKDVRSLLMVIGCHCFHLFFPKSLQPYIEVEGANNLVQAISGVL